MKRRQRVKAKSRRRSPGRSGGASAAAAGPNNNTDEDNTQEQGGHEQLQALLDMDDGTIGDKISHCLNQLNYDPPKHPKHCSADILSPQETIELYQRQALYRIRGYELQVDRKLTELDDATLTQLYPPHVLYDEGFFGHYESSLEWSFDYDLRKRAGYEDYQRLVLNNYGEYRDWERYKSTLHTYEDLAYVQYCEAIENETKWIGDYLVDSSIPAIPWERIKDVAYIQALKIATTFTNVSPILVSSGFTEHMWSIMFDFSNYMGLDRVYFEIWKRVAQRKMGFIEALSEIYWEKMFPLRSFDIEQELEKTPLRRWSMKENYGAYVACICDSVSDDEARTLITEALIKMSPKSKIYVDYARKKLEIAEEIGMITNGRTVVTPQCRGDNNGEGKLETDD